MSIEITSNQATADFLKKLRTQTAPYHTKLEEAGLSSRLMDSALTIETYKNILLAFYGFIIPAEKNYYSNLQNIFPRLSTYKRGNLLQHDLLYLGLSQNELNNIPQYTGTPFIKEAAILGCLYVLEGSKLGGQLISRHAIEKLKFTNQAGTKFFSAHGAETGFYWKEFINILSQYAVDTMQEDEIIEGAKQTFSNFGKWLKTTK